MDRSWMYGRRSTQEYVEKVEEFMKCAEENKIKKEEEIDCFFN